MRRTDFPLRPSPVEDVRERPLERESIFSFAKGALSQHNGCRTLKTLSLRSQFSG
jgi:hypothetical protein